MLSLAYTIAVELKERLYRIDEMRSRILATPLSPKQELKFQWDASINRIHASLTMADITVTRAQIVKVLTVPIRAPYYEARAVLGYRRGEALIRESWIANPKPVTPATILDLAESIDTGSAQLRRTAAKNAENIIRYLESQSEHPVVQAAIALSAFPLQEAMPEELILAHLTAAIYLAKYGYDIRGLSSPQREWLNQKQSYMLALANAQKEKNLNHWLLFIVDTVEVEFTQLFSALTQSRLHQDFPSAFWDLNDRQKAILQLVSDPTSVVTNKRVQKHFGVSQITASRDLTRLTTLGLLFSHGKGRSVSYTRI